MSNMSYCRFRNTVSDLRECIDSWEDDLGEEEKRAQKRLLHLCAEIIANYGEEIHD